MNDPERRPLTRLGEKARARLARVEGDNWFFARIADQVVAQRTARNLSQRELAELVGTTQSAIARLEAGRRPPRPAPRPGPGRDPGVLPRSGGWGRAGRADGRPGPRPERVAKPVPPRAAP